MSRPPQISVAICTYNRADYLLPALDSLAEQDLPPEAFEVLIIDNCSTDNTRELVEEARQQWGRRLRYVHEPRQGLSWARNRAISEARADLLVFLDDDAKACPGWLSAMMQPFREVTPRPVIVGGPVRADWEAPRPAWVEEWDKDTKIRLLLFSVKDESCFGTEGRWFEPTEGSLGGNTCYDRTVLLRERLSFDVQLGRGGSGLMGGEEGELLRQLRDLGYRDYYQPEAAIWHAVSTQRMTRKYARSRFYWVGRSHAVRWQVAEQAGVRETFKECATCARQWLRIASRSVRRRGGEIQALWRSYWVGRLVGAMKSALGPRVAAESKPDKTSSVPPPKYRSETRRAADVQ